MEGLLGVQVHTGPPMKIEFRNIRLRRLDVAAILDDAQRLAWWVQADVR
jgi:hypothetical protein